MANLFDSDMATIFNELPEYIASHTPSQMLADVRGSSIDPNDLPSLGDQALMFCKQPAHSKVLYAEGIRQLEAAPERLAPDCNLLASRRNLCLSCLMLDSAVEAFEVIAKEPQLIAADINLALGVTLALGKIGRSEEANAVLSGVDQIPLPDLLRKLEAAELDLGFVDSVKATIRKASGSRKMRDLQWLVHPEAGQPPDAVLDLDLDTLAKHGVPVTVLGTIKTGVLHRASKDGKMWFCEFFDVSDPSPLLERGVAGRFRVDFHTLENGRGRLANVYSVH